MPPPEIPPPWAEYPAYPPGDFFWRDAGQPWFAHVWEPYWQSLTPVQQTEYLVRWRVPEVWRKHYFDAGFRAWLWGEDD